MVPNSGRAHAGMALWYSPVADLSQKRIKRRPVLGGLISEYERAA